ncbi:exosome complex protein Rrp42 [Candidatus Woesearchaeota archaeon]|nr:exosome complex protein Rrp42 [Candidatus Woesearchaeota archaeon]
MMNRTRSHMLKFFEKGMRFDGRKLDEFREVSVEYGISKNAEGSARVKFGDTEVMAGIKMSVEKPYPDTPGEGNLMVGVELSPMSSPDFETGPPSSGAVELARVVDRGIRESKAMDTKQLCIEKGVKVWSTAIDIVTINADGNLIDASALAAFAALKEAKMPHYDADAGAVDYKKKTSKPLPLSKVPIAVTVYKVGNYCIVDPTSEEEDVADARLTVTSHGGKINALQKGGNYPLSIEDIEKMVSLSMKKAQELERYL